MSAPAHLLERLGQQLGASKFDVGALAQSMLEDGGQDFLGVTREQLVQAFEDVPGAPWPKIGFGSSELLAYYLAGEAEMPATQVLGALGCTLLLGVAIRKGFGDWEFEFDKALRLLLRIRNQVTFDLRMQVLAGLLGCKTEAG